MAILRFLSRKTAFLSAPKAFDACATLLFTSASTVSSQNCQPQTPDTETPSLLPPPLHPTQWEPSPPPPPFYLSHMCLVLGRLTVRPKLRLVCWYISAAFSAAGLVDARRAPSSANWHSVTLLSLAFLVYLLNSFLSNLY